MTLASLIIGITSLITGTASLVGVWISANQTIAYQYWKFQRILSSRNLKRYISDKYNNKEDAKSIFEKISFIHGTTPFKISANEIKNVNKDIKKVDPFYFKYNNKYWRITFKLYDVRNCKAMSISETQEDSNLWKIFLEINSRIDTDIYLWINLNKKIKYCLKEKTL